MSENVNLCSITCKHEGIILPIIHSNRSVCIWILIKEDVWLFPQRRRTLPLNSPTISASIQCDALEQRWASTTTRKRFGSASTSKMCECELSRTLQTLSIDDTLDESHPGDLIGNPLIKDVLCSQVLIQADILYSWNISRGDSTRQTLNKKNWIEKSNYTAEPSRS